uniref:Methylated-DNA--protein-cysteine methyltransferase n=1 Tax=Canis lupus familiaris TaxID=9615 RepID=A0A8C0RU76_CANLF
MDKACKMRYKTMDSPLGKIEISGCAQGLHEIRLHDRKTPDPGPAEAPTPPELLGCPEEMTEPLVQCVAWLDAYFREPSVLPGLPLPAIHHPIFQRGSFTARVLRKLLELVKFGDTVSYQQLAALAGNPKAARAVGGAMRSNPVSWPRVEGRPRRRIRGGPRPRDGSVSPRGRGRACDGAPAGTGRSASLPPVFGEGDREVSPQKHPFRVCQGPDHGEYGGGEPRLDNVASGHPSPHLGTGRTGRLVGVTRPGPRAAAGNKADGEAARVEHRSRRRQGRGSRPSPCA